MKTHSARRPTESSIEILEDRIVLATHVWMGPASGGLWNNAANWTNGVPTTGESGGTIVQFNGGVASTDNIANLMVDEIHFTADGDTISGTNGVTLGINGLVQTVNLANDAGNNTIDSSLPLALLGLAVKASITAGKLTLASAVSGTEELVLVKGDLALTGPGANTFTGGIDVQAGTLELAKTGGAALTGSLTVGTGGGAAGAASVSLLASGQIPHASAVTVNLDGALHLAGVSGAPVTDTIGSLTLISGTNSGAQVTTNASFGDLLTVSGGATMTVNGTGASPASIAGAIQFTGASPNITVPVGGTLDVSATIQGGFSLAGDGTLNLTGSVAGGVTSVTSGQLLLDSASGNAIQGTLIVGTASGSGPGAGVKLALSGQIAATATATVDGDAFINLNGFAESFANLTLANGPTACGSVFGATVTVPGTFTFSNAQSVALDHLPIGLFDSVGAPFAGLPNGAVIGTGNGLFQLFYDAGSNHNVEIAAIDPSFEVKILPGDLSATYHDIDGDLVKVTVTPAKGMKPKLPPSDFTFGGFGTASHGVQLQELDLSDAHFAGASVSFHVTKAATGDGRVDVGFIHGGSNPLGSISLNGDLGQIDAASVKSLHVDSMGRLGEATQNATAPSLESIITGRLGSLTVTTDLENEFLSIGSSGAITIGGSVMATAADDSANAGSIQSANNVGAVKIGGDLVGGVGVDSGVIDSLGVFTRLTIGRSIVGGSGKGSGTVSSESPGTSGPIKVGHDVIGGSDGSSSFSGEINFEGNVASATIGGSLIGGAGSFDGFIQLATLNSLSIGGSIVGGSGGESAEVSVASLGAVTLGHNLIGGSASQSGVILSSENIAKVTIGGSIVAGTEAAGASPLQDSAAIEAGDAIGSISVKGSLLGNATSTIVISARGQAMQGATTDVAIGKVTVTGSVTYADILAGYDQLDAARNADAQIGSVTVGGNWSSSNLVAGAQNIGLPNFGDFNDTKITGGTDSANIISKIASITIGGQVTGAPGLNFGFVAEAIGTVKIGGAAVAIDATLPQLISETGSVDLHVIP